MDKFNAQAIDDLYENFTKELSQNATDILYNNYLQHDADYKFLLSEFQLTNIETIKKWCFVFARRINQP